MRVRLAHDSYCEWKRQFVMTSDRSSHAPLTSEHEPPEPGDRGVERELAEDSKPVLGEILRRARQHQGLSLRQVESRIGVSNAHLSQIERGAIRRPDPAILMNLAELYNLNYGLIAEWSGYLNSLSLRSSSGLAGMALRLFVELDSLAQRDALSYLEKLRNERPYQTSDD